VGRLDVHVGGLLAVDVSPASSAAGGAKGIRRGQAPTRLDIAARRREVRRTRMTHKRYEFRVHGPLSEDARNALYGLAVVDTPPETIIVGEVVDESHLHGVLALIRSLDLHLLSMHEVQG
jgi:hypothetical protein